MAWDGVMARAGPPDTTLFIIGYQTDGEVKRRIDCMLAEKAGWLCIADVSTERTFDIRLAHDTRVEGPAPSDVRSTYIEGDRSPLVPSG